MRAANRAQTVQTLRDTHTYGAHGAHGVTRPTISAWFANDLRSSLLVRANLVQSQIEGQHVYSWFAQEAKIG